MILTDAISKLIGASANCTVANDGVKITLKELAAILTILEIESNSGDYYTGRTDDLIKKAYDYFVSKSNNQTADNIKSTYTKADGTPVIQ